VRIRIGLGSPAVRTERSVPRGKDLGRLKVHGEEAFKKTGASRKRIKFVLSP
jgi:hypothetical protein